MARRRYLQGNWRRPGRWRRRLGVLALLLLLALLAAGWYLTRPARLAAMASDLLTSLSGAVVRIERAELDWDGTVQLMGVDLRVPGLEGPAARLFEADAIRVHHDLGSLLRGRFRATSLTLVNAVVWISEDSQTGRYNLQALPPRKADASGQTGPPPDLPDILLRSGRIVFARSDGTQHEQTGELPLTGNLLRRTSEDPVYFFRLSSRPNAEDGKELTLSGRFALAPLAVDGRLESVDLGMEQTKALPRPIQEVWRQLDPQGSVPEIRFGYHPDRGIYGQIEVRQVALNLRFGDLAARMQDASGRFLIANQRVDVQDLTGRIDLLHYRINGWIGGLRFPEPFDPAAAPFHLDAHISPFDVPADNDAFVASLPEIVQRYYHRFEPSGRFEVNVRVDRGETGGKPQFDGEVVLHEAAGRYHKFPYPLRQVRGRLTFSNDKVQILDLRGRGPNGGDIRLSGLIAPPADGAEVTIDVEARDVPVDEHLLGAMSAKHAGMVRMLLDTDRYEELRKVGLVQSSADKAQIEAELAALLPPAAPAQGQAEREQRIAVLRGLAARPVFDLGGRIAAQAHIRRPLGPQSRYSTTVDVDPAGCQVLFKHWAYPARITGGKLHIAPPLVAVQQVELEGLSGARGVIEGQFDPPEKLPQGGRQLRIRAREVPLDDLLLSTINQEGRDWLATVGLSGQLTLSAEVFRTGAGDLDFSVDAAMQGGQADPWQAGYRLSDVTGRATIRRGQTILHELTGRHGPDAAIAAAGMVDWQESGPPQMQWRVSGTGLTLEPTLLDLIVRCDPKAIPFRNWVQARGVAASLDAAVDFRRESGDTGPTYRVDVRPKAVALEVSDTPVALTQMAGLIRVEPGAVEFVELAGRYGQGAFRADGRMDLGPTLRTEITFDAANESICPVTRAAVPPAVRRMIDGLGIAGAYDLRGARLVYERLEAGTAVHFKGGFDLRDAQAAFGVPITQLQGHMDLETDLAAGQVYPQMRLDLRATSLRAADRLVENAAATLASSDAPQVLNVERIEGTVYGGSLRGQGTVTLGDTGRYRIALSLEDVRLSDVVDPLGRRHAVGPAGAEATTDEGPLPGGAEGNPAAGKDTPPAPTGRLSASLAVEGVPGRPGESRGRGDLEIRDANLYETPLTLALLQIMNLSLPTSRSFDRCTARYLLDGDLIRFDEIRMESRGIDIVGAGRMKFASRELDLEFVSRNPGALRLGPITDLLSGVKDELVTIHVTGTLDQPKTRVRSFSRVGRTVEEVLGRPRTTTTQRSGNGTDSTSGQ